MSKITLSTSQTEHFDKIEDIYTVSDNETIDTIGKTDNAITFNTSLSLEEVLTKLHIEYEHPWLLVNNTADGFIIVLDFKLDCNSYNNLYSDTNKEKLCQQ